jgi:hypothetical protein
MALLVSVKYFVSESASTGTDDILAGARPNTRAKRVELQEAMRIM